jgi:hypothetical protein
VSHVAVSGGGAAALVSLELPPLLLSNLAGTLAQPGRGGVDTGRQGLFQSPAGGAHPALSPALRALAQFAQALR